ncbi:hypothetical protein GF402_11770 [Candidatus Fermentibacteria bacterium]|nr:hypothetical protein [Candidatus Fermentibacteria bacterium]
MMKAIRTILLTLLGASLLMVAGCVQEPELPEPEGPEGFVRLGWEAFQQQDFEGALEYFEQALDADLTYAEAYLGAGMSCLYLRDYWGKANEYFYMAIQEEAGEPVAILYEEESQTQDTMWTAFECVDPDMDQDSLEKWLGMTASQGKVWVSAQILFYLSGGGYDTDLQYRFRPVGENCVSSLEIMNLESGDQEYIDSVSGGYVYVNVPLTVLEDYYPDEDYYSWIMVDQQVQYDYGTFSPASSTGQISLDALAGWALLQDLRGENGAPVTSALGVQSIAQMDTSYSFGAGQQYEGYVDMDLTSVAGSVASFLFEQENYLYSWYMCKLAGHGLGLNPDSPAFLLELLSLIETMIDE